MSLRYYDPNGSGEDNLKNTVKSINFAVDHNVDMINYSGGGAEFSSAEFNALKRAERKGILVVAAAGNERSDADKNLYFPSAYNLSNIISVTAIDEKGIILPSSNWGVKKVHVAAPGQSILSTLPNGGYGFMSGTSQATAFVSGISAMLLSQDRGLSPARVRNLIEDSAEKYPQLVGKTKTGAKADAVAALELESKVVGTKLATMSKLASGAKRENRTVSSKTPARKILRKSLALPNATASR
jgi:subtilisin family serine protease